MPETQYPTGNVTVEYVNQPNAETPQPMEEVVADAAPPNQEGEVQDNQTAPEVTEGDDPKFAARFAALSRKEKELINRERAFKEQQAQIQAYEKARQSAKQNPLEYLQAAGLTLEEAIQQIIKGDQPPTVEDRVKSVESQIEEYKKQAAEWQKRAQQAKQQQELQQIHNSISEYVGQNSEQFELVHAYNDIDTVWKVIEQTYIETNGQVHLTIEQACQAVEEDLLEQKMNDLKKASNLKKLQKLLTNSEVSTDSKSQEVSKRTISPTLTNNSGVTTNTPKKFKTREESIAEAAKLLKWNE